MKTATILLYECFVTHPNGYTNPHWWGFSEQGLQWRQTRRSAHTTAFPGRNLPRTRVSWFESMAFCAWLSGLLHPLIGIDVKAIDTWSIRLPTEQQWQRAALGDTAGPYPWGDAPVDRTRAYCANWAGQVTAVESHPAGASPYGALDMSGNLAEWCVTKWGTDGNDLTGYDYRNIRGGAWNIDATNIFLQANDRFGHPPRGRLNDVGLRFELTTLRLQGGCSSR